jgi:hypothetical protein
MEAVVAGYEPRATPALISQAGNLENRHQILGQHNSDELGNPWNTFPSGHIPIVKQEGLGCLVTSVKQPEQLARKSERVKPHS